MAPTNSPAFSVGKGYEILPKQPNPTCGQIPDFVVPIGWRLSGDEFRVDRLFWLDQWRRLLASHGARNLPAKIASAHAASALRVSGAGWLGFEAQGAKYSQKPIVPVDGAQFAGACRFPCWLHWPLCNLPRVADAAEDVQRCWRHLSSDNHWPLSGHLHLAPWAHGRLSEWQTWDSRFSLAA